MHEQVGVLTVDADGLAVRGLLVRHLVLPGLLDDTREILAFLATLSPDTYVNVWTNIDRTGGCRATRGTPPSTGGRAARSGRRRWPSPARPACGGSTRAGARCGKPKEGGSDEESIAHRSGNRTDRRDARRTRRGSRTAAERPPER